MQFSHCCEWIDTTKKNLISGNWLGFKLHLLQV